ncbi:MAG: hypothetical protein IT293_19310 [Deltaproteobacteria bacterium]|nr:hypothetical protein [Deltaproteobacteria bacterium]
MSSGSTDTVFKITDDGTVSVFMDATGDGAGHALDRPGSIDADVNGNVYVAGVVSNNAFKITPSGVITQLIDQTGDGKPNHTLSGPPGIAVDPQGNVFVTSLHNRAFKISP